MVPRPRARAGMTGQWRPPSGSSAFRAASDTANGYLLKSIAPDGTIEFRTVRSHCAFVDAAEDFEVALKLFERPGVTAVSMTVTESASAIRSI